MAASARRSALRGVLAFTARRPLNVSHSFRRLHLGRPALHSSRHFVHAVVLGVPVIGGGLLFLCPNEESPVPTILASSAVIPCSDDAAFHQQRTLLTHQMSSPNEDHKSLLRRILDFLRDRIWEPFRTGERFLHLLALFLPVMITSPMLFVGKPPKNKRGERWGAVWWYGFLVAQMQRAGPTFIKLAQWAGSRQDLFPAKLCEKLSSLHSNGRPHSLAHTKRVIEKAFRRPFSGVFQSFDYEPIGVGAIAQVYRAVLDPTLLPMSYLSPKASSATPRKRVREAIRDAPRTLADITNLHDGLPPLVPTSTVAIKILHPGVEASIRRDLAIMSFFASCLNVIPGIEWLSLKEEVAVFGQMMNEQLDLRVEAANLRTFEKNFADRRSAVTFPRPLEDFSNKDVLVEEYQEALPLSAFLRNGGGPYDHRLANLGLDAFLHMLLLDNFVHSDLHPGNIMVKFYKPTTSFVYKNIFASIFHTEPPSTATSLLSDASQVSSDPNHLTPLQQSDAIVARLRPLICDQDAFLTELSAVAKEGYQPSLVFIDAGLTTVLNAENRRNFLDLFRAIASFDGYLAGTLMVERCRTPQLAIDKETFALKMQHLVLGVKSRTFSLAKIKISDILTQVLLNVRAHHVRMEGDFVNTVLAILLLEGIGRQLDPNMDLFKSSLPILRQLGGQMGAKEAMDEIPGGNLAAMLKIWVWIEARELVSSAIVNIDDMIKYDWLSPNI